MNKDVQALFAKINKEMGEGTVVVGSELKVANRFPTGSLALDVALGGGWPGGHWSEILGWESHGKTAVVLKTVAANQEADPEFTVLWMAAEHYDIEQAEALGVDNSRVIVVASQAMEFVYETILDFASSKNIDLIVLDSYPAMVADEEEEKAMDEATMTLGARLTGKFFRKVASKMRREEGERPIFGLFVNQWRDDIGKFQSYGQPKTSPGGKAKNFAFYTRVDVQRAEYIVESRDGKGKVKVGQTIAATTIKNKAAAPQQKALVDFYFRDAPYLGFRRGEYDEVKEIMTLGIVFDVIKRRGAYFDVGDHCKEHLPLNGKDALIQALREEVDLRDRCKKEILAAAQRPDQILRQVTDEDLAVAEGAGVKKVRRKRS